MNLLNQWRVFPLFIVLLLVACNKENIDDIIVDEPEYEVEEIEVNNLVSALVINPTDGINLGCLTIQFPFELLLESGNTATINTQEDFDTALDQDAPDPVIDFVFPLNIIDEDGNVSQINNNDELGVAFASCIPDEGWDESVSDNNILPAFLFEALCFDLVFPVNLEDEAGNAYVANNEAEFINFSATIDPLYITLPATVMNDNGDETTVNDVVFFFDLVYLCEGIFPPVSGSGIVIQGFGCNELVFPFNVTISDGSTVSIDDADEYANLIFSGATLELQYPFSLSNPDGEIIVINEVDDLIVALGDCGIDIEIVATDACATPAHALLFFNQQQGFIGCGYTVNFPAKVMAEGVTYTLNNMDDYLEVYNMYAFQLDAIEMIYPVSATMVETNSPFEFNSDEQICTFINGCE